MRVLMVMVSSTCSIMHATAVAIAFGFIHHILIGLVVAYFVTHQSENAEADLVQTRLLVINCRSL
jgi:hypothetical protein